MRHSVFKLRRLRTKFRSYVDEFSAGTFIYYAHAWLVLHASDIRLKPIYLTDINNEHLVVTIFTSHINCQ
jgi:hypothetical protein